MRMCSPRSFKAKRGDLPQSHAEKYIVLPNCLSTLLILSYFRAMTLVI